jgi:two-component system, LytTR family, sensor kinase
MTARNQLDTIYRFLSRRPVYHGLFWVTLFVAKISIDLSEHGRWDVALVNETVGLFFYAILVYFNLYYLIPNYLARQAPLYLGLLMTVCVVLTPIKVLVLYIWYADQDMLRTGLVRGQIWQLADNFFVGLLSTMLRVVMDWWRYQNEKQQLLTRNMQSELRFLKSQINPHFLFNTLNNLYALTLRKSDQAPEIVLKLSEIMRYMLYECNEKRVLLSKEVQYIHNYLDLERLRQPRNTDITFVTEGRISEQMVAPLLFVPFLENSFKHGLNHAVQGNGFVRLRLRVQDDDLEFTIENNKADHMPRHEHPRSGGIGLTNVRQRLQLLYPENHALEISDEPRHYQVTLHLKLI